MTHNDHATETHNLLDDVRLALSIGEPLSPGVVNWGEETLDVTILDTYGQTETGKIRRTELRDQTASEAKTAD